jgi:hypothetical protein
VDINKTLRNNKVNNEANQGSNINAKIHQRVSRQLQYHVRVQHPKVSQHLGQRARVGYCREQGLRRNVVLEKGDSVGRSVGRWLGDDRVLDNIDWPILLVKRTVIVLAVLWALDIDSLLVSVARMVPLGFGADFVAGKEGMLHLDVLLQ